MRHAILLILQFIFFCRQLFKQDRNNNSKTHDGNMANALEQLKALTTVVADTGDFESMKNFKPQVKTNQFNNNLPFTPLPPKKLYFAWILGSSVLGCHHEPESDLGCCQHGPVQVHHGQGSRLRESPVRRWTRGTGRSCR